MSKGNQSLDASIVYVVEDNPLTRIAIRKMLQDLGVEVRDHESAEEFLEAFGDTQPEPACLLLDLCLPGMDGLSLLRSLRRRGIALPVVIVTGIADVSVAVRALHEGALDLIEKPLDPEILVQRVTTALELSSQWRQRTERRAKIESQIATLSPREREVLGHMLSGLSHKVMADRLGIGIKTLFKHRAHALRKLEVRDEVQLLLVMNEAGLTNNSALLEQPGPRLHS